VAGDHPEDPSEQSFDAPLSTRFRELGLDEPAASGREQAYAAELRRLNSFLEALVESIPFVVYVKDASDLRYTHVNGAAEQVLGWSRREILGKTVRELFPPEQAVVFEQQDREVLARRTLVEIPEELVQTPHRGLRWLRVAKVAIADERGRPSHILGIAEDITARRAAESQTRDLQRFLDAIVENIPDMIFVKEAESLLFVRFNRAGEELLGWSRAELLGKTDHDFYPKEQADFFHAKDRETLANKKLVDVPEEPIETRQKGQRWLHTRKVPVLDEHGEPRYLLGISEDITERKIAEERVRALEREITSLAREAREAMISWTLDGRIVTWNPAAEALYGIVAGEAIGMPVEELVPEALRAELRDDQARIARGEGVPITDTYRLRSGQEIEVEESLFAVRDHDGRVVRIASIARDVSELAKLRRANELYAAARGRSHAEAIDFVSPRMRELVATIDLVAHDPHATVLLLGETGVGKSWLARRIHARSPRADKPFFEVNCASLGPQLVESELFGYEKGAFTGATGQKRGIVEAADGGTLFLDEMGELPQSVQAQLLTFLDGRAFRRVGGTRALRADVRVVAATNVDLRERSERGVFRKDLYYRLSVMPITVPALRERREDIAVLARTLLDELCSRGARRRVRLDKKIERALAAYDWPGNVRELRNALERALILARGGALELAHLPPEIAGGRSAERSDRLEDVEREHILGVLERAQQNRSRAAEILGISRSTLLRKLAELERAGD
jgi:PAS domain S-box-containing protein